MAIIEEFRSALTRCNIKECFVSFVEMDRLFCVTKEIYEDFYDKKGLIWEKSIETSIGDDVENFRRSLLEDKLNLDGEAVHSFHLSLVEKNVKNAIEAGCEQTKDTFWVWKLQSINPDVKKEDMDKSESRLKFALSWCRRNTVHLQS